MTVYLLHFAQPISPQHTTQHYIGSAEKVISRLDIHHDCPDARLLQVAKARGIAFALARTWPGGRAAERRIKNWKMGRRLCPICQGEKPYVSWRE